ncbi:MAG: (2Fe-2S)-binding protein [Novosphingobium sp.]
MTKAIPLHLNVNGREVAREVAPRTLLVDFLRDELRLTGTHVGCDTTQCGCCTVHLDGLPVKSCTVLAVQCAGRNVTSIESLAALSADGSELHPMQQAFIDCHALQCGFCTPGMIMAAIGIAERESELDRDAVRHGLEGNICRCTGYLNIERAVLAGAAAMGCRIKES